MNPFITLGENPHLRGLEEFALNVMNRTLASGVAGSFIHPIEDYLAHEPTSRQYYQKVGWHSIEQIVAGNPKDFKKEVVIQQELNQLYVVQHGVLANEVVIAVTLDAENNNPSAMYTSSVKVLSRLLDYRFISEEDFAKAQKALLGSKASKAILAGTHFAVRLDFDTFVNGKPRFKVVQPRSNLTLMGSKTHVMFPVNFMRIFEHFVLQNLAQGLFEFEKDSLGGQVKHRGTTNPNIVRQVYASCDPEDVESKINRVKVGYDYIRLRFDLYDLEASIHALGVASFRPEMLNYIKPINQTEVSTEQHNIDFRLLRGIFETGVNNLKATNIDTLTFIPLEGFANLTDKKKAIIEAGFKLAPAQLLALMQAHPTIFGDLNKKLEARQRIQPKFLKGFEPVELPLDDVQGSVQKLTELMNTGVVRFVARKKDGSLSSKTVSNHPAVLERIYGKDYRLRMESPKTRLETARKVLESGQVKSVKDFEKLLVDASIMSYINVDQAKQSTASAIQAIDEGLKVLAEKDGVRTSGLAEGMVRYRSLNAEDDKNRFYGTVNVSNILSVEYKAVDVK